MNYMENGGSCKNSQWGGCLIDSYTEIRISNYKKIQTQTTQKPMLRAEVGMGVRCANIASSELLRWGGALAKSLVARFLFVGVWALRTLWCC